jgi:hypothetical protein
MASNPMIIPESERYGKLKDFVFQYVSNVGKIKDSNPSVLVTIAPRFSCGHPSPCAIRISQTEWRS